MMGGWWIAPAFVLSVILWGCIALADDRGGSVDARVAQIAAMRASGERVEIRGRCDSACTMMLAVGCVAPSARLGFHGPQSQYFGIGLPPADFDRVSRVMADHYPPKIAAWFMATARHDTMGLIVLTGRQVIEMGARKCEKRKQHD